MQTRIGPSSRFRDELNKPGSFVITLELVPGADIKYGSVFNTLTLAAKAVDDGRIAAVSITDNPGGNPALMPDVLGRKILDSGMDVIIHLACRDHNRTGLESRALQLSSMGLTNILSLTGDYSGTGFGGKGAPVFDLDSVSLTCMLNYMNERDYSDTNHVSFNSGCAVSPFKYTEGETVAQYAKLDTKIRAGASFIISQLGYDFYKYQELMFYMRHNHPHIPLLGSLFYITPRIAKVFNQGKIPGAVMSGKLLKIIEEDSAAKSSADKSSADKGAVSQKAVERTARLGAILKGLGYKGVHIGGIHKSFNTVRDILDLMKTYEDSWENFIPEFIPHTTNKFYYYSNAHPANKEEESESYSTEHIPPRAPLTDKAPAGDFAMYKAMKAVHDAAFTRGAKINKALTAVAGFLDKTKAGKRAARLMEEPAKHLLLDCQKCGDCAIQHVGFLCPESQCPKHLRNGPCGGSAGGQCEVYPDKPCVWVRAYKRYASDNNLDAFCAECVLPRMWSLKDTSSWLNFYLDRDHQAKTCEHAMGYKRCCKSAFKSKGC